MTLEELQNQPKYVRVLASTYSSYDELKAMIGKECEVRSEYYDDKVVSVFNADKTDNWLFNRPDVQFLTPVEFEGKKIGIGDSVLWDGGWRVVYDYIWNNRLWQLGISRDEQLKDSWWICDKDITAHRPLQIANPAKLKWQQEMERLKEEGRKNGWE